MKAVGPDIRVPDNKPGLKLLDLIRFDRWSFEYFAPTAAGFELRLRVKAAATPLTMVLID
jgi:hypothetical protein